MRVTLLYFASLSSFRSFSSTSHLPPPASRIKVAGGQTSARESQARSYLRHQYARPASSTSTARASLHLQDEVVDGVGDLHSELFEHHREMIEGGLGATLASASPLGLPR